MAKLRPVFGRAAAERGRLVSLATASSGRMVTVRAKAAFYKAEAVLGGEWRRQLRFGFTVCWVWRPRVCCVCVCVYLPGLCLLLFLLIRSTERLFCQSDVRSEASASFRCLHRRRGFLRV